MQRTAKFLVVGLVVLAAGFASPAGSLAEFSGGASSAALQATPSPEYSDWLYFPFVIDQTVRPRPIVRRVNVPYFSGEVDFDETAIFWFGQVTPSENYADVRLGYNDSELFVYVAIFDRHLWYVEALRPGATYEELTAWDAVTLYLNLGGNNGDTPGSDAYRFTAQLNWWEEDSAPFQRVDRGNASGWAAPSSAVEFATKAGWRGNAPNNNVDEDRGWAATFYIPFASLGLSGPPLDVNQPGSRPWGIAVQVHDRDDSRGTPIAIKSWPDRLDTLRPATWGQLYFGIPEYEPPGSLPGETVMIRHGLNGANVVDAAVGGGSVCGEGLNFWTEWGQKNYARAGDFNIQNQIDIADWPCFSKYYITFPLDAVPAGKVIRSAKLTLHQFGSSDPNSAQPSLIQVMTVAEDWKEHKLTWNNAPLALQNYSAAWVSPTHFPGWPGIAREWDVSRAAADAYRGGIPLRLVLYSADGAYHSGKYFTASEAGDWNEVGRPTLTIEWGEPAP